MPSRHSPPMNMKLDSRTAKVISRYDGAAGNTHPFTLYLMSVLCLRAGGGKGEPEQSHMVKHNNTRWQIKTAEGGEREKGGCEQ